jgi:hypothetical protein
MVMVKVVVIVTQGEMKKVRVITTIIVGRK